MDKFDSNYDPLSDVERLKKSMRVHRNQDKNIIESATEYLDENDAENPYSVLDVGCGYGIVTKDRFGSDENFEVKAIDKVPEVIRRARQKYKDENIEYACHDAVNLNNIDESFDIVFSSYLLHHLNRDRQKEVLRKMWSKTCNPGCLVVRTCDDGQHLHYPKDDRIDTIVQITDNLPGSSDRAQGRKLQRDINHLNPEPSRVQLDMWDYNTFGLSNKERLDYFDVFHGNRIHYAEEINNMIESESFESEVYQSMDTIMKELRSEFEKKQNIFDAKTVPSIVAYK